MLLQRSTRPAGRACAEAMVPTLEPPPFDPAAPAAPTVIVVARRGQVDPPIEHAPQLP